MAKHSIAWLPGDGVGLDVMNAGRIVLDGLGLDAEYVHGDIGWEFWRTEGRPLPQRTIDLIREKKVALFGAITSKPKEEAQRELVPELQGKGLVYASPIVGLRQHFNLHTNLRPCIAFPGNPLNYRDDINIVVFRENTEDLYAGVEFHPFPDPVRNAIKAAHKKMAVFDDVAGEDMAVSLRIVTRRAAARIVRAAFEYAKKHGYKTVTIVEKPNVVRETSGLMVREARKVAQDYPGIALWETNIDAMCMWLLKNPQDYGILVASNLFGDIISDLCAQLVGGLGFAASANLGDEIAVFEPTHGSAPKYAGLDKVNPTAMILTTELMCRWIGEKQIAERIHAGVSKVVKDGQVRTYDMGGSNTTTEMAKAILAAAKG